MEIGKYYIHVQCESFLDKSTNRIRIRTIPSDYFPHQILVESLKIFRDKYPVGTIFYTEKIKICKKPDGRIYARASDQMLYLD